MYVELVSEEFEHHQFEFLGANETVGYPASPSQPGINFIWGSLTGNLFTFLSTNIDYWHQGSWNVFIIEERQRDRGKHHDTTTKRQWIEVRHDCMCVILFYPLIPYIYVLEIRSPETTQNI